MTRVRTICTAVAIVAVLAATACRSGVDDAAPANDAALIRTRTVGVEALGCSLIPAVGTGVVIEQSGIVTTVAHTVAGASEINVVDHKGRASSARVVFFDAASDVALLATDLGLGEPLPLARGDIARPAVIATWDRDGGISVSPVTIDRRLRVTIEDIFIEDEVIRTAIEFSGNIVSGDSGGPLVVDGSVAGIVYARARSGDRGFAIDEVELASSHRALNAGRPVPSSVEQCVP